MNIVIIPARGGSKGVPEKNIRRIAGKPLIAWSIESALKAEMIDKVVVSTDCDKIEAVSKRYGVEVVKRPKELATDTASSESALLHCLNNVQLDGELEYVVFRQCTSPLVSSQDIDNMITLAKQNFYDSVFSAYEKHFMGRWKERSGKIVPVNYDPNNRKMRQKLKPDIVENGAIYIFEPDVLEGGSRFGKNIGVYLMPWERSFQIDTLAEFQVVEKLMSCNSDGIEKGNYDFSVLKLVILDFDGTMTDNKVVVSEEGAESVLCNRSDGLGVGILEDLGIVVVCLTSEKNRVVKARCDKLGINVISSLDKANAAKEIFNDLNISPDNALFLGNDINDIPILKMVKYPVVVNDAHIKTKNIAKIVLSKNGGEGAVLELAELIVKERE
jgi:N-acylneuraminate cytidylyltransferase